MKKSVRDQQYVFDRIAPGWYNRRHWTIFRRELEELARRWRRGRLLNVGCGHGADFVPFCPDFDLCGLDFSREMLRFARKYSDKFKFSAYLVQADAASLPFAPDSFDWAIAIATYHHVQGSEARFSAIDDLRRVLKPGGEALITVWNRWQPGFWFRPKETFVSWQTKEEVLYRYYYLFSRHELENMVRQAGFRVLRSFSEDAFHFPLKQFSRNICLLIEKETD